MCDVWFVKMPAFKKLEARAGIEPAHKGFADLSLTTWVPRLGLPASRVADHPIPLFNRPIAPVKCRMERETRLELATLALARRCSTTELLPLTQIRVYRPAETGSNWLIHSRNGIRR